MAKQMCKPWKATRDGWKRTCKLGSFGVVLAVMSRGAWGTMSMPAFNMKFGGRRYTSAAAAKRGLDKLLVEAAKMHRTEGLSGLRRAGWR